MDQASNDPAVETTGRPFATRTYEARRAHEAREAHDKRAPLVDAWYGSGAAPIEAVDSHAHVFLRSLPRIPSARHSPEYDATLESYVAHLSACGITHAVLVQPSFLGTDNHFFVDALARYPQRFRGIAVVNPCTAEDEFARLEATDVVGIRLNLVGLPIPDFTAPRWRALLARANALGWHVEVHRRAADLPAIIPALLDQSCRVVVDHFGRPAPHLGTLDPGFRFLLSIAGTGQVWVKLSAAYRNIGSGDGTAFGTRGARAARRVCAEPARLGQRLAAHAASRSDRLPDDALGARRLGARSVPAAHHPLRLGARAVPLRSPDARARYMNRPLRAPAAHPMYVKNL